MRIFDIANLLCRKTAAFQSFAVDAPGGWRLTGDHRICRYITTAASIHSQETMRTDIAKLMGAGESSEYCPVTNMHMSCQRGIVGEDRVVTYVTVMSDTLYPEWCRG